jgi:hypothetical protein
MLVLHDPSGLVAGTAADMRAMAEALDRMKAGMVAAYRAKSGRDDAEIEALMQAETWLSAQEAVALGLADRVEQPVRMAAHFDLSRFRNLPPHLAATLTSSKPQEDEMSDSHKTRPRRADPDPSATAQVPVSAADTRGDEAGSVSHPAAAAPRAPAAEDTSAPETAAVGSRVAGPDQGVPQQQTGSAAPAAPASPTAQVIDLDAVRADERKATLAYVSEVHELCALAARGDLAANFIAKATPVAQIRRALLEARAAEDEATAIRSQVRPATVEPAQPAIDTAAIYAARNQHCR